MWYTQDVRVCPPAHTGRPWLSVSTHRTFVAVCVSPCVFVSTDRMSVAVHQYTYQHGGPWTQHAGPSRGLFGGYFGPRGLSVQYTQDVCGCPSAHIGRSCVSISTHRTSVAVLHTGRPCVSVSTHRTSVAVRVCPCVSVNTHRTSVAVHQYTYQHAGPWTKHAGPSVHCLGDFDPRGLSVQYTHDVRGCPLAHTGCLWLSISTHISTLTLPVDCSGDFGPRGLSIQYTQDVRGCPSAHTGRSWVSVSTHRTAMGVHQHTQDFRGCPCVSVCVRVCPSTHKGRLWLSISTHISTLALPVDCSGDFSPRGLSVQYTQDVRGCPPAYTGHPWLSVSTDRTSVAVRVCQCVSVCVRQHTQDVRGCPSEDISARWSLDSARWPFPWTGRPCVSVSTHRTSVAFRVCLCVSVSTNGTSVILAVRGMSVAVCVCLCVSVSTHRTSVAVHQYTYQHAVHTGRPWVSASIHRTSVAVRQHRQDVCGCPCVSVCVRVCPSTHTGRPWLSISRHISTLVLGLSTLALPVDWSGDFGPRGLSIQYTQDVRGCSSAHTGRPCVSVSTHRTSVAFRVCPCVSVRTHRTSMAEGHIRRQNTFSVILAVRGMSVAVRVCLCVSVSTHRTSVAVHQYTYQHAVHTGRPWVSESTHRTSVAVRQHTQDVRGCPCVSVCVRDCPSAHPGRPWFSINTQISTLVLGLSTLALPVDCSVDFGPRRLFIQYQRTSVGVRQHTQDVCGCLCVSVCVCVCLCVSVSTHRTSVAVISTHVSTLVLRLSTLTLPVDCSSDFGPRGLFVQYTQDICGCPSAHTGRLCVSVSTHRTSVAVRVCPSAHTRCPWLSISTHISTLVLGLSTLTLPVYCLGDFGPHGLSVQYTQDVLGCPPAHTGRPWLSVCVRL
ncbi:hypothetical protein YC2023_066169 [Brassica napus]